MTTVTTGRVDPRPRRGGGVVNAPATGTMPRDALGNPYDTAAPTEAEIRKAIAGPIRDAIGDLYEILGDALAPIADSDCARTREPDGWADGFNPRRDHPGTFWADLTKAEADDLAQTVSGAIVSDEAAEGIVDAVVAAVVEFSRRHPDMPRGRYPVRLAEVPRAGSAS